MTEEERIDPAEMRTALGTCIKDKELQRLFKSAPEGAKKVLKLTFYSTVFPEKIDGHRFKVNLQAIEPELTAEDLQYLIRFETHDWLKNRFKKLLAEKTGGEEVQRPRKLGILRPNANLPNVDLNAEAIKRKMEIEERERVESAERSAAARRKARMDALKKNAVFIVVAVVVAVGGLVWFSRWNAERRRRESEARVRAELLREEENARYEAEQKSIREQQEKERAERKLREEKRRAEREAEQAKRLEEEKKRNEEREAKRREEEARDAAVKLAREKYAEIERAFAGAKLLAWGTLPKSQRPGAVDGKFRCMIPSSKDGATCYEIDSKATGAIKVYEVGHECVSEVDFDGWNKKLLTFGGVVHNGTQAYLFAPKAIDGGWPIPPDDFNPSRMRLGDVCDLIGKYDMVMDRFAFDVRINSSALKESTLVDTVSFGESFGHRKIDEQIRNAATASVKKPKAKSRKRTVVMYDGGIVKRQMNGVTLVPRNPVRYDAKYSELRAEAERQERETASISQVELDRYQDEVRRRVEKIAASASISIVMHMR